MRERDAVLPATRPLGDDPAVFDAGHDSDLAGDDDEVEDWCCRVLDAVTRLVGHAGSLPDEKRRCERQPGSSGLSNRRAAIVMRTHKPPR